MKKSDLKKNVITIFEVYSLSNLITNHKIVTSVIPTAYHNNIMYSAIVTTTHETYG